MSLKELKRFIIVHGEKPYKGCQPHQEFFKRLEKAIELADKKTVDGIMVSGGTTRKNCPAEASFGAKYLQKSVEIPVFVEENSRTTIENIKFTKEMLIGCSLERVIVISSKKRLFRLQYLYGRLWRETRDKIEFVGVPDSYGIYFYFLELLYFVYSIFDVNEYFLPRLAKKLFRNG
ncbi:TPA: hypothetical protein DCP13_03865 [Candidatus Azambacteria bacterium]|nr:hypothetical protein [Candidatus Azambacteria bacterium]